MLLQSNRMLVHTTRTTAQRLLSLYRRQIWVGSGSTTSNKIVNLLDINNSNNKNFNNNKKFSSYNNNYNEEVKNKSESVIKANASSPVYTLFRSNVVFTLKFLPPTFKKTMNDNISIDRKGKIQFGFTPRVDSGSSLINWPATNHVIIGVEDIGTILYNVNNGILETMFQFNNVNDNLDITLKIVTDDTTTTNDTTKNTIISLEQVDGHDVIHREITLNEGEFEVLKTFLVDSIPHLTAWDHFINLSIRNMYVNGPNRFAPDDPYAS